MKKYMLVPFVCILAGMVNAETIDELNSCAEIKNNVKRLQCFDAATVKANRDNRELVAKESAAQEKLAQGKIEFEMKRVEDAKRAENEKVISAARQALNALKKIETRVNTGVSYRDYPNFVSDAKYEVNTFLSQNKEKIPDFSKNALKAIDAYDFVVSVWRKKFIDTSPSGRRPNAWVSNAGDIGIILNAYPSASSARLSDGTLHIDAVLSAIWGEAGSYVRSAENAFLDSQK